jgi:hypothetical protein
MECGKRRKIVRTQVKEAGTNGSGCKKSITELGSRVAIKGMSWEGRVWMRTNKNEHRNQSLQDLTFVLHFYCSTAGAGKTS